MLRRNESDLATAVGTGTARTAAVVEAFAVCQAQGLIALAGGRPDPTWPLTWSFWREFAARYLTTLCQMPPASRQIDPIAPPDDSELSRVYLGIPPMPGAEYCSIELLRGIWNELHAWCSERIGRHEDGLAGFLQAHAPLWRQVGRVCFHLAENRKDPDYPFAFLASYIPKLGKNARAQHQPLNQALTEYAGARNRTALLRLLEPIQEAGSRLPWVEELVQSGDIYHPLAWSPEEAYLFLQSVPELEAIGLVVRLPDWWKKRTRPRVQVVIGNARGGGLGADALLDFQVGVTLDGGALSDAELKALGAAGAGLTLLRGQWVEVDGDKLRQTLEQWKKVRAGAMHGLSFAEGMRLLSGARRDLSGPDELQGDTGWAYAEAGDWLRGILAGLRDPGRLAAADPGPELKATLRPYQKDGVNWLLFLNELGLGACLADDMGLGKTIQVIALLLALRKRRGDAPPSLLVLPASLVSNWVGELERFAPSLRVLSLHPSEMPRAELERIAGAPAASLAGCDAVLTTYGMLGRQGWLAEQKWDLIVLDEAQAIKNPGTRQAKEVKALQGRARLALTGTPVENRLGDLWSLFDFLSPGLLGSSSRFKSFVKTLESGTPPSYAPVRRLVQPYILRRMKTDRRIIDDLPEKVEMTAWCGLSKAQAALYR